MAFKFRLYPETGEKLALQLLGEPGLSQTRAYVSTFFTRGPSRASEVGLPRSGKLGFQPVLKASGMPPRRAKGGKLMRFSISAPCR